MNAHVGQEDLIEFRFTGHLVERANIDTGGMHIQNEIAQTLVLWNIWIRSSQKHPVVRCVRQRRPHLLTVDDPFIPIADCATRNAGNIGTVGRF
ncbi:unannotated protein [freshwater metagenome]|uniref:Unannotated protein n=1 Tax=freshwater metagenome TaxID=449393 RepID=A0A6J5Z6K6_9ZZZZ